ncbi:MAG TPA: hypothetical protein VJ943_09105 [Desulfotignum sp.]|nr:hypothetical protein [Desulfotignum sp.]
MDTIIESRTLQIKLADGTRIRGEVNLNRGNGYDRLSDLVGDYHENFLTVFNAAFGQEDETTPASCHTILINKSHILFAIPEDDMA